MYIVFEFLTLTSTYFLLMRWGVESIYYYYSVVVVCVWVGGGEGD